MSLEMFSLLPPGFSALNFHHNLVGGAFAVFEDFAVRRSLPVVFFIVASCLRSDYTYIWYSQWYIKVIQNTHFIAKPCKEGLFLCWRTH